jgi:hypothetical protein
MPEYAAEERFWREFESLTLEDQRRFLRARDQFIAALMDWEANGMSGNPRFPKSLGVKSMVGRPGVKEFTWAPDGRATWCFGIPHDPKKCLVVWRRIGSHEIYRDP